MRNLAVLLAVVGLASIGGSIWAYCHDRSLADPVYLASQIQFDPDPVQLGDLAQNDPRTIEVRITNHLPVPMTVLGANSGCDQHACLAVETSLPFTIGAGETAKYSFKYLSRIVGPLHDEHDIYTDAGTFHLQLRGLVAAAPSPAIHESAAPPDAAPAKPETDSAATEEAPPRAVKPPAAAPSTEARP